MGHQTESVGVALEVAIHADQLTFGPALAARRYVDAGLLVEVEVAGWDLHEEVFLAYETERVPRRLRDAFVARIREVLAPAATTPALGKQRRKARPWARSA